MKNNSGDQRNSFLLVVSIKRELAFSGSAMTAGLNNLGETLRGTQALFCLAPRQFRRFVYPRTDGFYFVILIPFNDHLFAAAERENECSADNFLHPFKRVFTLFYNHPRQISMPM